MSFEVPQIDLVAALGPDEAEQLRPYVERMIALVEEAGGVVLDVWPEFGAPEIRFRLPDGSSDAEYTRVRRAIVAIQQEVP